MAEWIWTVESWKQQHMQQHRAFGIPKNILPEIRSSAEHYGTLNSGALQGVPITAVLGDQQAALVGQLCWEKGSAKNTWAIDHMLAWGISLIFCFFLCCPTRIVECSYGTGCFLLYNTGNDIVYSTHGLITTVAYKFGDEKPVYALEVDTIDSCVHISSVQVLCLISI